MFAPVYRFSILQMAAHATLSKAGHAVLDVFHLNSAQWRILGLLSEHAEGCRIADIAEVTFIQSTQINAMVRDMLQRGLIRKAPHPTDKRANLLHLTSSGQDILGKIEQKMQASLAHILRNTPDADFKKYVEVLRAIKDNGQEP